MKRLWLLTIIVGFMSVLMGDTPPELSPEQIVTEALQTTSEAKSDQGFWLYGWYAIGLFISVLLVSWLAWVWDIVINVQEYSIERAYKKDTQIINVVKGVATGLDFVSQLFPSAKLLSELIGVGAEIAGDCTQKDYEQSLKEIEKLKKIRHSISGFLLIFILSLIAVSGWMWHGWLGLLVMAVLMIASSFLLMFLNKPSTFEEEYFEKMGSVALVMVGLIIFGGWLGVLLVFIWNLISTLFDFIWDTIVWLFSWIWNAISTLTIWIWDTIVWLFNSIGDTVSALFE